MKKYVPTILAVVVAAAAAASGAVQAEVSSHPTVAAILGAAYAILAHWLPSPKQAE